MESPSTKKYAWLEQRIPLCLFFTAASSARNMNTFLFLDKIVETKQCVHDGETKHY